jgi:fructose-specific component phosphotransferase system IIB-like protein
MSDIKKGYTFTDKSTDWASNKDTAIRLNKMMDEAEINLVAGSNVTITPTLNGPRIDVAGAGTGTVTSVAATGGTGISVTGSPITTSGTLNIVNTAPDQTVALTQGGTTTITGTYPNFTISSADQYAGTVTSVSGAGGSTGLTLTGGPITGSGTLTLGGTLAVASGGTGTASPSLVAGTNVTISGSWPNQTVNSTAGGGGGGTVTSVSVVSGNGLAGTVANATTTPAITLSTTVNGLVKGNGTTLSAAAAGSDYQAPITLTTTGTSGAATFVSNTLNIPQYSGGGGSGTVTSVSVATFNGVYASVANPTTTPVITLSLDDISAATSKPNVSGSVTRTFANRAEDVFNVKDYGATGDGFTNDTTAVSNTIAASVAFLAAMAAADIAASRPYYPRGATVFFPQGTYRILGTQSAVIGTTSDRNIQSLTFLGEGSGVSIILQETSNAGFIDVELANRSGRLNVIGLQVFNTSSTQLSSAAAFKVAVTEESGNDSHPNLFVQDVHVAGISDGSSKSFTYGFDLLNIHMGSFESYMFCGNNSIGGTGARLRKVGSATPTGANKCIDVSFSKCRFNLAEVGIEIKDAVETCLLQQCLIVDCRYGVKADYCIHLGIQNCHINSKVGTNPIGIYATGTSGDVDQAVICGSDIYAELNGATSISGPFTRSVISGNNFIAGASNTGTKGITTSGNGTVYVGNAFYEYKDYYVTLTGSDNICRENTFTGTTPTNTFVDSGTNNSFEFVCSTTWDPASLVSGQQDFVNISCPGAKFGAQCTVGVPYDVQNMFVQATVTSANNVRIAVYNSSGGTVNLGSGTWTVRAKTGPR